jgi:hypothetical protein
LTDSGAVEQQESAKDTTDKRRVLIGIFTLILIVAMLLGIAYFKGYSSGVLAMRDSYAAALPNITSLCFNYTVNATP